MKLKIFLTVLTGLLITCMPVQNYTMAANEVSEIISPIESGESTYAAVLTATCSLSCAGGSKNVYVSASVYGNDIMSKIGFKNIKIQRSSDKNNWTTEKTISDIISKDTSVKTITKYSVSVKGGYYHRVVLDNYAKEGTWWFPATQTVTATSNLAWVAT